MGLLTIIIHGRGGRHPQGYSGALGAELVARGEPVIEHTWSGNIKDHAQVANTLSSILRVARGVASKRGEPLNVISHSWGTVIAYRAISTSGVFVSNFITMGSPLRADTRPANVGRWINYWSPNDGISALGRAPADLNVNTGDRHTAYWNNRSLANDIAGRIVPARCER